MLVWILTILFCHVAKCQRAITPYHLVHVNDMDDLAQFGDAQHRGPHWYDYTENSAESASALKSEHSSTVEFSYSTSSEASSSDSSKETTEKRRATQLYRTCTPCPHDMLKKHSNVGIKWICGSYQRARRSFKSECMMRYRNCQDGTMFVKLHDRQCKNDSYHGRHWFYQYKV